MQYQSWSLEERKPPPLSYSWSPVTLDQEENKPPSLSKHASCLYGNRIYVFGGKTAYTVSKGLWQYDLDLSEWRLLKCSGSPPPSPYEHTMVAYKNKLFVFGAEFSFSENAPLWILDLDSCEWKRHVLDSEVVVPLGRRGHTAVVCNSGMHIFGGYIDLTGSSQELWTFDLENKMWHLAPLSDDGPGGRHDHSAVMYNGCMYIFGGMNGLQTKDDLWCWHFASHTWTKMKTRGGPPPIKGHCACRLGHTMLVYGGGNGGIVYGDLWSYHFITGTWTKVTCSGKSPSGFNHISPCNRMSMTCLVMVPSLSPPSTDRTQSVPYMRDMTDLDKRPYSSPANIVPKHHYKKKVMPEIHLSHIHLKNKENAKAVRMAPRTLKSKSKFKKFWSSSNSISSTHDEIPLCDRDSLMRITSSLDSLLDACDINSNSTQWVSMLSIRPRSVSRSDLVLEDLEYSKDNFLDDSQADLLRKSSGDMAICNVNDAFCEYETSFIDNIKPIDAWASPEKKKLENGDDVAQVCSNFEVPNVKMPAGYFIYFIGGSLGSNYGNHPLSMWKLHVTQGK